MFHLIDGKSRHRRHEPRSALARHRCDHCRYRASIASGDWAGFRASMSPCPLRFCMPIAEAATGEAGSDGVVGG